MIKLYVDTSEGTIVELLDVIEEFGQATAVVQFDDEEYAIGFFEIEEFDSMFEFLGWL